MVVPTGAVVCGRADGLLAFEVTSLRNEVGPIANRVIDPAFAGRAHARMFKF